MSLVDRKYNAYYKKLWYIDQATNTGVDTTIRDLKTGDGASGVMGMSKDAILLQPKNSDSTTMAEFKTKSGTVFGRVDSTNKKVMLGESLVAANTQYAYFGACNSDTAGFSAGHHYALPFGPNFVGSYLSFGTGTDPDTSVTITTNAHLITPMLWYIPDNITISSVSWLNAADTATGDTCRAHLVSYDIDKTNTSTGGDLSAGVVIADGSDIVNAGYEAQYWQDMTVQSANVDAGKVCAFCFRSDTVNSDYSITATVKYYIR